jgi:hypothetical protein
MPRLVGSYDFFTQGIVVALGTGAGRNHLELDDKLEHSGLCVF